MDGRPHDASGYERGEPSIAGEAQLFTSGHQRVSDVSVPVQRDQNIFRRGTFLCPTKIANDKFSVHPRKKETDGYDFDATSFSEDGDGPNKERSKYTPDLYIPAMAFMTYVLLTCISLGLDNRFGPTMIFKNAANCSLLTIFEALLIKTCVYIAISKNPPFLDTLSLASYKYYGLCFIIITNLCITSEAGGAYLDWTVKIYYCVTSAFGMYQMVKRIGEREPTPANSPVDPTKAEDKLRAFALGLAAGQIFLSWILIKLSQ
jgi:hypothetical protein